MNNVQGTAQYEERAKLLTNAEEAEHDEDIRRPSDAPKDVEKHQRCVDNGEYDGSRELAP